ncbi:MAG: class I SAM-dependent methyltransferase [Patescibacteria group bacterium]
MTKYLNSEEIKDNKEMLKNKFLSDSSWAVKSGEINSYIKNNISKDAAVLDIGCGGGETLKFFETSGFANIFGFDIDNYVKYPELASKVKLGNLNFERLPFEDKSIGLITAFQVLEHLENPFHFERECARILKPGGLLIMSMPSGKSLWSRASYFMSNNITGYDLINNHITFLTADIFQKTFLKDFDKEKEIYDRGFVPYLRGLRLPPHRLLSKRVCYFLRKK